MPQLKKVCVVYGGKSCEHEVSKRSAAYVIKNIDRKIFDVHAIAVDKQGDFWPQKINDLWYQDDFLEAPIEKTENCLAFNLSKLSPSEFVARLFSENDESSKNLGECVVFPVLHGTNGEDGTFQGLCEMAGVALVGSGSLGSAVAMDKWVSKRLASEAGIEITPYVFIRKSEWLNKSELYYDKIQSLGTSEIFVKPNFLGSSIGISKVDKNQRQSLNDALEHAFRFDSSVIVEEAICGRELECAVLGQAQDSKTTWPAEIVVKNKMDFYSYQAKYEDPDLAKLVDHADINGDLAEKIQKQSDLIFNILNLSGMARIDFFWDQKNRKLIFNEANTIPGFTQISQYPRMWAQSGVDGKELCKTLIEIALKERSEKEKLERNIFA